MGGAAAGIVALCRFVARNLFQLGDAVLLAHG